jgi:hypothetical protein
LFLVKLFVFHKKIRSSSFNKIEVVFHLKQKGRSSSIFLPAS